MFRSPEDAYAGALARQPDSLQPNRQFTDHIIRGNVSDGSTKFENIFLIAYNY